MPNKELPDWTHAIYSSVNGSYGAVIGLDGTSGLNIIHAFNQDFEPLLELTDVESHFVLEFFIRRGYLWVIQRDESKGQGLVLRSSGPQIPLITGEAHNIDDKGIGSISLTRSSGILEFGITGAHWLVAKSGQIFVPAKRVLRWMERSELEGLDGTIVSAGVPIFQLSTAASSRFGQSPVGSRSMCWSS